MIELPELSILLILEHLSYEDLQSLRVTCKKLKEIVDKKTLRSLHLLLDRYPFERELLHTGELVNYANTFHAPDLNILKSTKFKSLFIGLRKLTIYKCWNGSDETVNVDDLNCFHGLLHLQLEKVPIGNGKLNLKNLKIVFVENYETTHFYLDCPQLQVLGLGRRTTPRLTQETANSVQHLYLRDTWDMETYLFFLYAKLRGLSIICFGYLLSGGSESLNTFVVALMERRVCLPSLKQIQLKGQCLFPERGVLLRNLAELKRRNETKHLQVRIHEKVMSRDELIELLDLLHKILPAPPDNPEHPMNRNNQILYAGDLKSDLLRHFNENQILHCLLPNVLCLKLRSEEDVRISKQLIGKLTNLLRLTIRIALDEHFFKCILKTCGKIWELKIFAFDHLEQEHLDQIPD